MISLLSAGFVRLFRNMAFRIGCAVMMLLPVMAVLLNYANTNGTKEPLDGVYNAGIYIVWLIIAAFVSMFISQDYDEKTLNNRIIAGHSRISIYFSDLIVTMSGAVIMQAAAIIAGSAAAIPLFGMYTEPAVTFIVAQSVLFCVMLVYTALVLFISTAVNSKTYAQGISMFIVLVIFIVGNSVFDNVQKLRVRAAQENIAYTELVAENSVKDIMYYSLPSSQTDIVLEGGMPEQAGKMIVIDIAAASFFTALGSFIFRRKDIK